MNTALVSVSMRLVVSRTLAWGLLVGGWLVLGVLGHTMLPLWIGGLAPVALWLAAAGVVLHLGRSVMLSAERLRQVTAVAGLVTAVTLAWAGTGGGAVAVSLASISWGVLLVAASRAVRMMRAHAHRVPPPVTPAAAGAALAWLMAGDPTVGVALATAPWLVATAAMLAALLPSGASGRGCRAGLFDCALPVGAWAQWRDPATWTEQSARWAMLPMMASLAIMTQWCGRDWGLSASQAGGLHLCAMLLPPLALHLLRVRLRTDGGAAAAMVAGLATVCWWPGMQGLMAASMCHSLAWGLVWYARVSGQPAPSAATAASNWLGALVPALCICVLGFAIAGSGPSALRYVHIGLGMLAAAGVAISLCRPVPFKTERSS